MSLGLAPFSGMEDEDGSSPTSLAMRIIYRYGGFLLHYRGLREFKAKFQPQWEPRYLVYRTETELPGLALATMQVGELKHARREEPPQPRPENLNSSAAPV